MDVTVHFTPAEVEEILRKHVQNTMKLKLKSMYVQHGIIEERSGMQGFIGIDARCVKATTEGGDMWEQQPNGTR